MNDLPLGMSLAAGAVARQFAEVQPGAPAVMEPERVPRIALTVRARVTVAEMLTRTARMVAPAELGQAR